MKIAKIDAYSRRANVFRQITRSAGEERIQGGSASKSDALAMARSSEAGFTLAEIMVASALLALVVVSMYGGISFGFASITLARQNLRATQIALVKMEITR